MKSAAEVWCLSSCSMSSSGSNALISLLDCQLVDHPFNVIAFWRQVLNLLQPHLQASMGEELQELCQQGQIGNADFETILGVLHEKGQRLILLLDNFDQLIRTQVTNETVTRDFLSLFFFSGQTAQSDWTNPPK